VNLLRFQPPSLVVALAIFVSGDILGLALALIFEDVPNKVGDGCVQMILHTTPRPDVAPSNVFLPRCEEMIGPRGMAHFAVDVSPFDPFVIGVAVEYAKGQDINVNVARRWNREGVGKDRWGDVRPVFCAILVRRNFSMGRDGLHSEGWEIVRTAYNASSVDDLNHV
jgi:hypothetical protein